MAYRRYSSSRRRFANRSSRSRGRMSNPARAGKWEASNFAVETLVSLPDVSAETVKSYIHLASINMSLASASDPNNVGTALASMTRKMLIGGVVFDHGVDLLGPQVVSVADRDAIAASLGITQMLVTDRLVVQQSAQAPNSITSWDPYQTEFPTARIFGNTTPVFDRSDAIRPTRIHFQRSELVNIGQRALELDTAEPPRLQIPGSQYVRIRNPTVNKRLKLVLDDELALFLCTFYHAYPGWTITGEDFREARGWFRGTLYWRYLL